MCNYGQSAEVAATDMALFVQDALESIDVDLAELYVQYRTALEGLLNDCVAADCIAPVDTRITASILLGTLDGLLLQWIMDRTLFDIKEAIEFIPQLLVGGLKKEDK